MYYMPSKDFEALGHGAVTADITAAPRARAARARADPVASWHMPRGCSGSTPWPRAEMARIAERWLCHHHLHLLHQAAAPSP